MKIIHLGNGIVAFENAMLISETEIKSFINSVETQTKPQGYKEINENQFLSDGGYRYNTEHLLATPQRFQELVYPEMPESNREILENLENTLYQCLVEYCRLFPACIETVRWKTRGYVIKYLPGQSIGPHCDNNLPYDGDSNIPLNTFPIHNTLTSGILLNDDFEGGELYFRSWGIQAPKKYGTVIIYPSSFTGCHEVTEVLSGVRYAYLSWYGHGTIANLSLDSTDETINSQYSWLRGLKSDVGSQNLYPKQVICGPLNY